MGGSTANTNKSHAKWAEARRVTQVWRKVSGSTAQAEKPRSSQVARGSQTSSQERKKTLMLCEFWLVRLWAETCYESAFEGRFPKTRFTGQGTKHVKFRHSIVRLRETLILLPKMSTFQENNSKETRSEMTNIGHWALQGPSVNLGKWSLKPKWRFT